MTKGKGGKGCWVNDVPRENGAPRLPKGEVPRKRHRRAENTARRVLSANGFDEGVFVDASYDIITGASGMAVVWVCPDDVKVTVWSERYKSSGTAEKAAVRRAREMYPELPIFGDWGGRPDRWLPRYWIPRRYNTMADQFAGAAMIQFRHHKANT